MMYCTLYNVQVRNIKTVDGRRSPIRFSAGTWGGGGVTAVGDGGHEQLMSNGGRFKSTFDERDKKQYDKSPRNLNKIV